jgi:tetratricopeptide (TPR) repeat protein
LDGLTSLQNLELPNASFFGAVDAVDLSIAKNDLYIRGLAEKKIKDCEAAIEKYGHSNEPGLMEKTALAIINKGLALRKLDKNEEAIACYEAAIEKYGHSNEPALMRATGRATWLLKQWKL